MENVTLNYGAVIILKHDRGFVLSSRRGLRYAYRPSCLGEQVVGCELPVSADAYWRIVAPPGIAVEIGRPLGTKDVVRLEHVETGRFLRTSTFLASGDPVQQEVTCWRPALASKDSYFDWRIEVDTRADSNELRVGGAWFRLINEATQRALHSHDVSVKICGNEVVPRFWEATTYFDVTNTDPNDRWTIHSKVSAVGLTSTDIVVSRPGSQSVAVELLEPKMDLSHQLVPTTEATRLLSRRETVCLVLGMLAAWLLFSFLPWFFVEVLGWVSSTSVEKWGIWSNILSLPVAILATWVAARAARKK